MGDVANGTACRVPPTNTNKRICLIAKAPNSVSSFEGVVFASLGWLVCRTESIFDLLRVLAISTLHSIVNLVKGRGLARLEDQIQFFISNGTS